MAEREPKDTDVVERHLARAWQAWTPEPDLRERVRARLTSSAAATMGAVGVAAAGARRPGTWASLRATGKLGTAVGATLLGIGFLSGYLSRAYRENESLVASLPLDAVSVTQPVIQPRLEGEEAARAPEPLAMTPPSAAPTRAVEAPPEPKPRELGARRPRSAPVAAPSELDVEPSPSAAGPNEELALLRRAERAVRADHAALALALIGELEERHPRSSLLEERRAIELLAHCQAGATDSRQRAKRFLRAHPQSLYASRIRELCETPPGTPPSKP